MTNEGVLLGQWTLRRVGSDLPEVLHIKSLSLRIEPDGRWFSEAALSGPFEGTDVKAEGQWSAEGALLRYSVGDAWEETRYRLSETVLSLRADLTLVGKDGRPVSSEYIR